MLGRGMGLFVLHIVHKLPALQKKFANEVRLRKSYKNARVTPSGIKETKIPRSEGNWGDHPHYPKN